MKRELAFVREAQSELIESLGRTRSRSQIHSGGDRENCVLGEKDVSLDCCVDQNRVRIHTCNAVRRNKRLKTEGEFVESEKLEAENAENARMSTEDESKNEKIGFQKRFTRSSLKSKDETLGLDSKICSSNVESEGVKDLEKRFTRSSLKSKDETLGLASGKCCSNVDSEGVKDVEKTSGIGKLDKRKKKKIEVKKKAEKDDSAGFDKGGDGDKSVDSETVKDSEKKSGPGKLHKRKKKKKIKVKKNASKDDSLGLDNGGDGDIFVDSEMVKDSEKKSGIGKLQKRKKIEMKKNLAKEKTLGPGNNVESEGANDLKKKCEPEKLRKRKRKREKIEVKKSLPTTIEELLETGLLDGYPVSYKRDKKGNVLRGAIKNAGILCYCSLCKGLRVVRPSDFEVHARNIFRHEYICLENGKSLLQIVKACTRISISALEETIKSFVVELAICQNCKVSGSSRLALNEERICNSCVDSQSRIKTSSSSNNEAHENDRSLKPVPITKSSSTAKLHKPSQEKKKKRALLPTPEVALPPIPEEALQPTPEEALRPIPEEALPPTPEEASPPTPEEASSPTPEEASPPTPEEASPPTPEEATPPTPAEASLPTPAEALPPTPEEVSPPTPEAALLPTSEEASLPTPVKTSLPTPEEALLPTHDEMKNQTSKRISSNLGESSKSGIRSSLRILSRKRSIPESLADFCLVSPGKTESKRESKSRWKITKKDLSMHKLVFGKNGLPEGTEVAYYTGGQKLLEGYKKGSGIFCRCCCTEVSASLFEAHAGCASRKKPYGYIYTSNGVSLHELAISLLKERTHSIKESDNICIICMDAGDLLFCDGCPRAFHKECASLSESPVGKWYCRYCKKMFAREKFVAHNANAVAAGRVSGGEVDPIQQIAKCCIRIVKHPDEPQLIACVLCREYDCSKSGFGPRTVILCDQCEKEYHVGCLKEHNIADFEEFPKDPWFCCEDCQRINSELKNVINEGEEKIPESFLDVLKKKVVGDSSGINELDVRWTLLSGKNASSRETRSLLSQAVAIFHDRFDPIIDPVTGCDLIPTMVYGRNIRGQDFRGMYCAVLSVGSVVISAGLVRIFGVGKAELPLVATRSADQGKGYFQVLLLCVEKLLASLKVKSLVLPAAEIAESIWTDRFSFKKISPLQLVEYRKEFWQLLSFKGTSMLEKQVPSCSSNQS